MAEWYQRGAGRTGGCRTPGDVVIRRIRHVQVWCFEPDMTLESRIERGFQDTGG